MQRLLNQPTAPADNHVRARTAEEEREALALLAQFMRHDSVASLAQAIAARSGGSMRAGDLIAAAGWAQTTAKADAAATGGEPLNQAYLDSIMPVNPGAGLRA